MSEIRESNPYTISWSNVSDYYHPKTFFAIARKCSAPSNTVHYLYSMNWTQTCYGTSIFEVEKNWPQVRQQMTPARVPPR
jgi:hypothetical protein